MCVYMRGSVSMCIMSDIGDVACTFKRLTCASLQSCSNFLLILALPSILLTNESGIASIGLCESHPSFPSLAFIGVSVAPPLNAILLLSCLPGFCNLNAFILVLQQTAIIAIAINSEVTCILLCALLKMNQMG